MVRSLIRCRVGKTGLNNQSICKPPKGAEPGVRRGKRSLLASHTRCKCSMETTHNSVKVKLGIKVMTLVESLIVNNVIIAGDFNCTIAERNDKSSCKLNDIVNCFELRDIWVDKHKELNGYTWCNGNVVVDVVELVV